MKFLRILLLMLGGAAAMVLSLMWVAQFFTGKGDVTPVIWMEEQPKAGKPRDEDSFAEWQEQRQ